MSLPLTRLWPRIEPILDAVVDLPEPLRSAKARSLCAEDFELGAAVARLLRADASAGDFLGMPVFLDVDPEETTGETDGPGRDVDRIGPFLIVRELGRGGMGRVLLGERDDGQFEQRVAIKILHGDLTAGADRETILRERRILARLEHPRIARMYDGGVTASGEPYFVMEHVDGLALDAYCEKTGPPLARRLELFREICRAVEFAHGRFIVHCDIKPRNILVTADGEVKLLDFGIAGLVDEESQGRGQRVRSFTPAYAAPEQIRGEAVTAATDVYQLGLVLKGLVGSDAVPADLQAIVAKALRADPASRYATAEALRRDLEDFLEGRPVAAFGSATGYRVRKWIGRYRLAVSATAAIVVALALGLVGVGISAGATARARDRAATAERRVSAVNEFVLHELLEAPMPEVAMGRDLTVAEVLGNASRSVEHAFQGQPATEAEVRLTLAHTYAALGRFREAGEHARAAKLLLAGSPDLAPGLLDRAERTLAGLASDDGRLEEARTALEALQAKQTAARGASDEQTLWTSVELARALKGQGELARAEQVLRGAAELARRDRAGDWRLSIEIDRILADVLALGLQGNESEALARSVLDTMGRHLGVDHPERVRALMQLVIALNLQLRYPESAEVNEAALTLSRKVFGSDHPMTAEVLTQKALS
ncbi:MAG TPA: serine/threonine-protein kinase, partial [Candidatus Bathyarchaeia archaeon]|nr:serine/threonine-protein kinase [Candidatus Bathyarchaeia archaeon]